MDFAPAACHAASSADAEAQLDTRLMAAAMTGDAAACARLVDRHLTAVQRFAWRQLGHERDAEDVAQDVFLRLWQRRVPWSSAGASLRTWLLQITRNLCVDRLRQRRGGEEPPDLELVDEQVDLQADLERRQVALDLHSAIASLPERQRTALALCHDEGLSNAAAAQVMALSVDALESLLSRARRTLRSLLSAHADQRGSA